MAGTTLPTKNTARQKEYPTQVNLSIRQWRNDVYEALELAGLEKIADRWLSCAENHFTRIKPSSDAKLPPNAESVWACSGNHKHDLEVYSQTCDLRICPDCASLHSARLVARYLPKCLELLHSHTGSFRFRHIVFTLPYALTDPDIKEKYLAGFNQVDTVMIRAMKDDHWRQKQGYISSAEFGESGLKLHYHVVHYGKYLPQADLSLFWSEATEGAACVVYVTGFPFAGKTVEKSLEEVLKYATKFHKKDPVTGEVIYLPPDCMPILAKVLEKTRRVRSTGCFYNLPEPDRANHSCDTCGAEMVAIPRDYFVIFCNTGMFPQEYHASKQPLLQYKPADKSSQSTSGIAPPATEKQRAMQKELGFLKGMRDPRWD